MPQSETDRVASTSALQAFPLPVPLWLQCQGPTAACSGRGPWPRMSPSPSVACHRPRTARRLPPVSSWGDSVRLSRSASSQVSHLGKVLDGSPWKGQPWLSPRAW